MESDLVYLVYDVETTGLSAEKNSMIEVAMYAMDNNFKELGKYSSGVFKPIEGREIQPKALEANGVTMNQLNEGKNAEEVLGEVIKFIKSLKKPKSKIILCGHNIITFDNPFFDSFFQSYKKDLSSLVNEDHFLDTLVLARAKWVELPNYKLGTCCQEAKIVLQDAHRALADTLANAELLKYFLKSLRGEGSQKEEIIERPRVKFEF